MVVPPILNKFKKNIRVSSNQKDTDIDTIMKKIIENKIDARKFDPVFATETCRQSTKGLIFGGSKLAPYKRYVEDQRISGLIEKSLIEEDRLRLEKVHINTNEIVCIVKEDDGSQERERSTSVDLLPYHLGANALDFQKAKWLVEELNKRSYYDQAPVGKYSEEAKENKLRAIAVQERKMKQK